MSGIINMKRLKIVQCILFVTIIFIFPFCKKDRSSPLQTDALGISGEDYYPLWSPDGKKISFISDRHGEEDIYIMNPDG